MTHPHDLVRRFHQATDLPARTIPTIPAAAEIELRIALLREECQEAIEALESLLAAEGDDVEKIAHVAKELADVIYVAAGAEVTLGLPGPRIFAEVHRSNMSKLPPCPSCEGSGCTTCHGTGTGPALRREDGKILKPATYSPADIKAVLAEQAEGFRLTR